MQWEQNFLTVKTAVFTPSVRQQLKKAAALWHTAVVLFKLRVVSLLLLSAYGGAMLGTMATGQGSAGAWIILSLAGLLSAGGASGINQYLERDQDTKMRRTAKRPLAQGEITNPQLVLWLSLGMVILATGLAAMVNGATAVFIALGAIIYVAVYTIWLKPRTIVNIVIGGAAGSCAVLAGGAAMGAWSETAVWLLALLIFAWTPVHFWALALAYREDYQEAQYPMLPARVSATVAARWTALHTLLTIFCGLALGFYPTLDWVYLVPIAALSVWLVQKTWQLMAKPEKKPALTLFHFSNIYLAAVLIVILLAPIWR
ncbi:MAG: protoheme IX farnesyltransferase [Ardenticatenaceae bacterium]|nr:protoheme IX farnesyltransferase [Ardenticatenaceae bacterium]